MIEVSKTKAYSVTGVEINGQPMISIRQMYRKRDDPKWWPSRQGVVINVEAFRKVVKAGKAVIEAGEFEKLDLAKSDK